MTDTGLRLKNDLDLHCKNSLCTHLFKEVSPASRLAGDFLVSCQPAGRRPKSLLPAGYWNTDTEMAFAWHCDIKL